MPCNVSVRGALQSTPSVGRATKNPLSVVYLGCISIHALRGESDQRCPAHRHWPCPISIHALREEGDFAQLKQTGLTMQISIHALREEGDPKNPFWM